MFVNDFKWQINYVKAIKLNCYQRLEKFNAILCAKYHNRSLLTRFIRANIVTSPTLCCIMATAVYADPEPQSLQALKHRLRKAWKSISLSALQNLIGSMRNRLKAVITRNILDCNQSNYSSRIIFSCSLFLQAAV